MKKFLSILSIFCLIVLTTATAEANVNSYDKYGRKTGSYRQTNSGYNTYNQYGQKTGSYRETSNGYNKYDKYGKKTGSL